MAALPSVLDFDGCQLDVVDHMSQPWIRGRQIDGALGYSGKDTILRIYDRHADEFTEQMTAVVKLETAGGRQDVRIFSLRGCHLLAMFARTPVAKRFRVWVLDVLEGLESPSTSTAVALQPRVGEADSVVAAGRCFAAYLRSGRMIGLPVVSAMLRANAATATRTGVDLMRDLDVLESDLRNTNARPGSEAAPIATVFRRAPEFADREDEAFWYFSRPNWIALCGNYSAEATARHLRGLGYLLTDRDRLTKKTMLPGRPSFFTLVKTGARDALSPTVSDGARQTCANH